MQWALEALDVRGKYNIEKASTLDLLGCIYLARFDTEAALDHFEDALKLRLKYLGKIDPYHPDIGVSYHNLGKAMSRIPNYLDAQAKYAQAEAIYRHNFPTNHPLMLDINRCLRRTQ